VTEPTGPSQQYRSPWTELVVKRALAEQPPDMSAARKVEFITELAARLSALQAWDQWDPRPSRSVTLKRDYWDVGTLDDELVWVPCTYSFSDGSFLTGSVTGVLRVLVEHARGGWKSEFVGKNSLTVWDVQGLPDGRIVSASDKQITTWVREGERWRIDSSIDLSSQVNCFQALPGGDIVAGLSDGTLVVNHLTSDRVWEQHVLTPPRQSMVVDCIHGIQRLPDGRIAAAHHDGSLRLWSRRGSNDWSVREVAMSGAPLRALHATPDGRIVVGVTDGVLRVVDVRHPDLKISVIGEVTGQLMCVQALPDGRILSSNTNYMEIWSCERGVWTKEVLDPGGCGVYSFEILADGRIITACGDNTIRIWDGAPVSDGGAI